VSAGEYRQLLLQAGFTWIVITPVSDVGGCLYPAIVHAARPSAPAGVLIRPMHTADARQVLAIDQARLDTGQASFETAAPSWGAFDAARLPLHRHVAADAATGQVLGWAAASLVSSRCVYAGVVEHSLYVDPAHQRRGIGAALLDALTGSAEAAGIWTIQSGIFPENIASPRLHHRAEFRTVGIRGRCRSPVPWPGSARR
jgi:L-amino acid N-acyltransferase YncA